MSMSSVSKSPFNNEIKLRYSTVGCDDVPTEIIFYIFKKLNITSLRCCLAVSRKWRDIASCICEGQDLWQALVEDGMMNHGVMQHLKSTLSWRDLYYNSFLWNKLPSVALHKLYGVEKLEIKNMHVYRDKLIVVNACGVEYYDIESFQIIRFIPTTYCVDVQESDDIFLVVTGLYCNSGYRVTVFMKITKHEEIDVDDYLISLVMPANRSIHAFAESLHWRLLGNRVYVFDSARVLWECSAKNNTLSVKTLAKYYGNAPRRGSVIHVFEEDVYVSLQWGGLLMVTNNSKMFRKVDAVKIPTKIIEGSNLNSRTSLSEGFDTFSALIKFPFGVEFVDRNVAPLSMMHYHYNDPEMTCGLQHGDVVFRGFEDGKITIDLLRDDFKYNLNVQQFDDDKMKELAVIALDICELKDMHKLFVATKHKLFTILLEYPNDRLET